jgi:transcriptional regulator with XRE-family HTH domain
MRDARVSRPERPIDPLWPLASFASGLRALRQKRGYTYKELAGITHYSRAALSTAAGGKRLPSWELTRAYVLACGGPVAEWRARWGKERDLKRDRNGTSHG